MALLFKPGHFVDHLILFKSHDLLSPLPHKVQDEHGAHVGFDVAPPLSFGRDGIGVVGRRRGHPGKVEKALVFFSRHGDLCQVRFNSSCLIINILDQYAFQRAD